MDQLGSFFISVLWDVPSLPLFPGTSRNTVESYGVNPSWRLGPSSVISFPQNLWNPFHEVSTPGELHVLGLVFVVNRLLSSSRLLDSTKSGGLTYSLPLLFISCFLSQQFPGLTLWSPVPTIVQSRPCIQWWNTNTDRPWDTPPKTSVWIWGIEFWY